MGIDIKVEKIKKEKPKKEKTTSGKKCRKCSFDCTVNRAISVMNVKDSEKAKKLKEMFGDSKPAYTPDTCKKG